MPAPLMHIDSSPSLPREADVVVIGGGVVGRIHGILSRTPRRQRCPAGEGARCRRTVQPQLGLVPPAEP